MATKRRKSRKVKKSRRSCKYGKLKKRVKTKSGRKRRCKKKSKRTSRKKSKKRKKRKYRMEDDSVPNWIGAQDWGENEDGDIILYNDYVPVNPIFLPRSRCKKDCVGKTDPITLEDLEESDNAVLIDKQCYNPESLRISLRANSSLPHNRQAFTERELDIILNNPNSNECL